MSITSTTPAIIMILPPGAFITLGLLIHWGIGWGSITMGRAEPIMAPALLLVWIFLALTLINIGLDDLMSALLAVAAIGMWQLARYGGTITTTLRGRLGVDPLLVAELYHNAAELETLYRISQILAAGGQQKQTLAEVLDTLDSELGMNRGTVTLLSPDSSEIKIEVAHNLSPEQSSKVRYRMGEGITGKVIESGKAMVVPKVLN